MDSNIVNVVIEHTVKTPGPCEKCGAYKGVRFLKHHIVYEPDNPDTAILCESCHKRITSLNTKVARLKGYKKLCSVERKLVFFWFMQDVVVLKRYRDSKVLALIEDMSSGKVISKK